MPNRYYSISNILIILSILATIASIIDSRVFLFGMNTAFLDKGIYHIYLLQFITSQFIHGGIFHLMFNSLFIYYFGNILEGLIGKNKFIIFFIFTSIFSGIASTYLNQGNSIGISDFAIAIMVYYYFDMHSRAQFQESKGVLTAIFVSIAIGFTPGVSLIGHVSGAIAGLIFYYINKNFFKPRFIGKSKNYKDMLHGKGIMPKANKKI